jgi:CIC family chloride channel protein
MGAMLSGALGVPLTAILFSLELTHAFPAMLPLTLACTSSYLVTSLLMPRSILTEKLSRRGYHLSREYGVDPLEMVSVADVMTKDACSGLSGSTIDANEPLPEVLAYSDETCRDVAEEMATTGMMCIPVVDRETGRICGRITAQELLTGRRRAVERESERNRSFGVNLPKVM